jgi:hypothetical protein
MYVSMGLETESSFEAAIARDLADGAWGRYLNHSFYYEGLSRWNGLFGAEQVRIHLYEDLRDEPERLLRETFEWLGVNPTFTPDVSRRYNVTSATRSSALDRALHSDSRLKDALRTVTPKASRRWITRNARQLNRTRPAGLSPETRRRLVQLFKTDIEKVAELIGRDLSHWLE